MSRINDWYWGGHEQNCKLQNGGVIIAIRHIKKGEQLCMSYGSGYCWDSVKGKLLKELPRRIQAVAHELQINQYDEQIQLLDERLRRLTTRWREEMTRDKLGALLERYIDGLSDEDLHPYSLDALEGETFEGWVERVLRSRGWNARYRFNNWQPWRSDNWDWVHAKRERRRHKHPRKSHNDAADWVETGVEELIPLTEEIAEKTTGRWTIRYATRELDTNLEEEVTSAQEHKTHEKPLPNLRIITYNVGGLSDAQEISLLHTMKAHRIDYAMIVDSRCTCEHVRFLRKRVREALGPQYRVTAIYVPERTSMARRIGGQLHIYRADTIKDLQFHPEDHRGAMGVADFNYGHVHFRVVTIYLPNQNDSEESLWTETGGRDSHRMLLHAAKIRIREAMEKGWNVVMGGDFNCTYEGQLRQSVQDMGLTVTGNSNEPSWRNAITSSRIDYLFHAGSDITSAWGGPREMEAILTDHIPVLGVYTIRTEVVEARAIPFRLHADIKRGDKKIADEIRKALGNTAKSDDPEEDITCITKVTVQTVRRIQIKRKNNKWVDGWSPEMMALQHARRSLIVIRRHLFGEAQSRIWTPQEFRREFNAVLRRWKNLLSFLANKKPETAAEQLATFLDDPQFMYSVVQVMGEEELRRTICTLQWRVKRLTHGRTRTEQRMKISERVRRREESRQAGRLRPVLESMLGPHRKRREGFTMETLKTHDKVKADPVEIHQVLTDNFKKWFATPEDLKGRMWMVHDTLDEFRIKNAHLNIPENVLTLIWNSLQNKAEEDDELGNTPTFDEFDDAINHMGKDSAPGISGLSYNMIKTWDPDTRKRVYEDIARMWEQGQFPQEWKQRWIVPIPKKTDPDISDLRPLTLMEALRKMWGSIFVRRIQQKWKKEKLLQPNQHGSVKGKSTDGAVADFLNAAEATRERATPMYITSWDIRRAFDSVAKPLVKLALRRLGVPERLTDYLQQVDEGQTIVRTPWALHCAEEGKHAEGFHSERGIGQGDVMSPLIWTAFFDILLSALAQISGGIITSSRHGYMRETPDIAYVDDLISVQGDLDTLQAKADIVSGFCIWAGLTLATDKFRAFAINWGNPNITMGASIRIHTTGWEVVEVEMKTDGNLKHLGVVWDMDLSNETQRRQIEEYLHEALAYILARRASAWSKIVAITKCLIPKLLYVCKFMGWTMEQYGSLERKISAALRKVCHLLPGFPSELLYMKKNEGGLGLDSLIDIVQRTKFRMYQRLLDDAEANLVASAMLARAYRARGQPLQPHIQAVLQESPWVTSVWATSLVQWMELNGATLEAMGADEGDDDIDAQVIAGHRYTGLYTKAERTGDTVRLRTGQFWTSMQERQEGAAIEIVGINNYEAHGLKWTSRGEPLKVGTVLRARPATHGEGAGPDGLAGSPEDLVKGLGQSLLLSVTGDRHTIHEGVATNECTILDILDRQAVRPREPDDVDWPIAGPMAKIYTDGTFHKEGTLTAWATGKEEVRAAAGIVMKDQEGERRWRITDEIHMTSAYDAEVIALAAAGKMARDSDIYSDCQAAIGKVHVFEHRTGIAQVLRISDGTAEVHKVRAHAERRKPRKEWTEDEEGNVEADAAAADLEDADGNKPSTLTIMNALRRVTPFVWKNRNGQVIFEPTSLRSERYTSKRDAWRASAVPPRPLRWQQATNRLAAQMWQRQECSWAMAVRIMWDKHVTGENDTKWNRATPMRCSVCNALTSQRHTISECNRPGAAYIRQTTQRKFAAAVAKHGVSLVGRTLTIIQNLLQHEDAYTIWTGMWTPEIRGEITTRCRWPLCAKEVRQVKQALSILVDGVIRLYRLATPVERKRTRTGVARPSRTPLEEWLTLDEDDDGEQKRELDERDMDARRYDR